MILTRRILIQIAIFILLALTALGVMVFGYMRLPEMMGVGQYRVKLELHETGGLYPRSNVTYRGAQVGVVDSANLTLILDLTLSRIDQGIFTGSRWECDLTWLELQWGRTIGQFPSPCMAGGPGTAGNPLIAPYRFDQGP